MIERKRGEAVVKNQMLLQAAAYLRSHRRKKTWYRVVTCLAAIVVFCTTYALILPAITMEKELVCGMEAHEHGDNCYLQPKSVLECTAPAHSHTDSCYGGDGSLICPDADYLIHTHGDLCYDAEIVLVCTLQEVKPHVHTDDCYFVEVLEPESSEPAHTHTDDCYVRHQGELICEESTELHVHGDSCYEPSSQLICGRQETDGHTHGDSCYSTVSEIVCDKEAHAHGDDCYQSITAYICGLEESQGHQHSDACDETSQTCVCEEAEHTHSDACYKTTRNQICGREESEEHAHSDACFESVTDKVCTAKEHTHTDSCYQEVTRCVCGLEESEGHQHSDACIETQTQKICEKEEHSHTDSCCQEKQILQCGREEEEAHTHCDTCYETVDKLICKKSTDTPHAHTDTCYAWTEELICTLSEENKAPEKTSEPILICTQPEIRVHQHSDSCYTDGVLTCGLLNTAEHNHTTACLRQVDPEAKPTLICELEEHVHDEVLCYIDLTADVETEEEWKKTLPEKLDGETYAEDLIAVAESQLDYAESTRNVQVDPDGRIWGYTRYGAWYGEPYGQWDTMFVSFCLHYVEIDEVKAESSAYRMVEDLKEDSLFLEDHQPQPGDLMFLTDDEDKNADRVGIIVSVTEEEIKTIEGDTENNCVEYQIYEPDDEDILGYYTLPEKPIEVPTDTTVPETTEETTTPEVTYYCDKEEHTHGEDCYDVDGNLICELEEHTHTEECQAEPEEPVYYCGKEEHTHGEDCYDVDGNLICDLEEHTHAEECQVEPEEPVYYCGKEEHTHGEDCYDVDGNLICELEEHTHTEECQAEPEEPVYYCGKEEHTHTEDCYDVDGNLICELEEHTHNEDCLIEPTYYCGKEEHTHSEDCYDEEGNLICQLEEHTHTEECLIQHIYHCGREEHTHNEECYDVDGNLICELVEHTHIPACEELEGEALSRVLAVVDAIDAMPSADEIDAKVAQFQEQEDEDGEVAYLEEVYAQVQLIYLQYRELGEELQQYVINADKLMALEYIWSAATFDYTSYTSKIYHINTYSATTDDAIQQISGTVMFVGAPVSYNSFIWWKAVVVEWESDGYMHVKKILPADGVTSKTGEQASDTGFILLFHEGIKQGFPYNVAVGDYVSTDFFIHQDGDVYSYNANGYGSVTFTKEAPSYNITSAPTHVLQYQENGGRVAHTSHFVDLNVYNYNYNVNKEWRTNAYYPGFQWPGGAYISYKNNLPVNGWEADSSSLNIGIPNFRVHRQYVDSLSFGDSIVKDHEYANSKTAYENNANGSYGKAVGATGVAKVYDQTAAQSVGKINWLWYSGSWSDDSISNRPAGLSTTGKAIQYKMNSGAPITVDGISLKYLFPSESASGSTNAFGVTKQNSQSVDGLFQVNPVSGLYYYNSHNNHAQYSNNKFTLYKEIITPNFLLYPFGNFLPFNDINTEATQVGAFNNSGGMKTYVNRTVFDLQKWMADGRKANGYPADPFNGVYGYSSRYQLGIMLSEYAESWHNAGSWDTVSSGGALSDFFGGEQKPNNSSASFPQEKLNNMYNIDWDQPTDFFFGMDMSMNFLMPKDGLTGHDNGNNTTGSWTVLSDGTFKRTGEPDNIPDYPLVFNFAGDDDVWVYVDGLLFLDLTGIHRHVGGTIDFETGMVYYFGLDTAIGDTTNNTSNANYYYAETFEEIIKRSYSPSESTQMNAALAGLRPVLDANGNQRYFEGNTSRPMKTFKDYSTHTFKFFYMERGSGSSVCRINFNFPMLRQNAISVSKKNVPDDATIQAIGNPDYYFNIIKSDSKSLFIDEGTRYTILDQYGKEVGTGTVGEFGIFTIKAGQTAVFEGITENSGKYYVQELIKEKDHQLYAGKVNVNGGEPLAGGEMINWAARPWYHEDNSDAVNNVDNTGPYGEKWYFYSSHYTDASVNSTFFFEMQNGVITKNLGTLSLSKQVQSFTAPLADTSYRMYVELDGQPLGDGLKLTATAPDGTTIEMTVGSDSTGSYVELLQGETVTIPNIISGTKFKIWESDLSSAGYKVDYSQTGADDAEDATTYISGIVRVNTNVVVTITNSENGTQLEIPGVKRFRNFAEGDYHYTFTLTEVDQDCNVISGGISLTETVNVNADNTDFKFAPITYLRHSYDKLPATHYYLIEEPGETANGLDNTQHFLVEVTVREDETSTTDPKGILAEITKVSEKTGDTWTEVTDKTITFTNTLTGDLSLEKKLEGVDNGQEFGFIIKLNPGESGVNQLPISYLATLHNADGSVVKATLNFSNNDSALVMTHGEKIVIHGIPIGTRWTITEGTVTRGEDNSFTVTETPPSGYIISGTVNGTVTEGNTTSGNVTVGGTEVVYTNTSTYTLPETGGVGTIPYTMAGLMLMLLSAAFLLYKTKKCRREVG